MATSSHRWESDPLFPAAEVVQDSADRMESIFCLLQHEKSLIQSDHPDPKLLRSIEHHRRDLATTLETAKWQMEDFEKAVHLSSMPDNPRMREDIISRYDQFIGAIRQQILQVEKSLNDSSMGDSLKNAQWVDLNEQDRDGLALFLSGKNHFDRAGFDGTDDGSLMRRFLDPNMASSSIDSKNEIIEYKTGEIENLNLNGVMHTDHDFKLVKVSESRKMGFATQDFLQGSACDKHAENRSWDLESSDTTDESFFHRNKLRGLRTRFNIFSRFVNNFWSIFGSGVSRSFTKRFKDGEEQKHSPTYNDDYQVSEGHFIHMRLASGHSNFQMLCSQLLTRLMQCTSWLMTNYQRSPYHIHVNRKCLQLVLMILFIVIILVVLVS